MIVLDVGKSMSELLGGDAYMSRLDLAKKALRIMIQQKLLFTKRDEMGLVLVGTNETANILHDESGGYDNIRIERDIAVPNLEFLESVDGIESETSQGDVIDGLLVAMTMINRRVKALKFTKRIFLITDAAGEIQFDQEQFDAICEGMIQEDYKLNVIGINFADDDEEEDEEGGGGRGEHKHEEKSAHARSPTQIHNERILRRFANRAQGACLSASNALELLSYFHAKSVNQVTKFRGDLEIGTGLRIPVYTYAKTMQQHLPSLMKLSAIAQEADNPETGAVRMDRTYWNKSGAAEVEVAKEDRVRSFKYGRQHIPFLDIDEKILKYECDKSLKLLGFYRAAAVPRHEYMSSTDIVIAEPRNFKAGRALSALIHALFELDMVAAVRYVKRRAAQPLFGVLIPHIDSSIECLYFNQLPFFEDVRQYPFPSIGSNPNFAPSASQLAATRGLITAMSLVQEDADGDEVELLKPERTFNPVLQRFYQCVQARALDEGSALPELDPLIAAYVNPDQAMMKKAEGPLATFKDNFMLVRSEKVKKQKRHWREYYDADPAREVDEDLLSAKKIKTEGEAADLRFEDIVAAKVVKIGTVDPVKDFQAMMERRTEPDDIEKAIAMMIEVVKQLVKADFNGDSFPKVVDCLVALRKGCVIHEEPHFYNDALRDYKYLYQRKLPELWKMIVEAEVYPIDNTEVAFSHFSKHDSRQFFFDNAPKPEPVVSHPQDIDEDDLWGSMN